MRLTDKIVPMLNAAFDKHKGKDDLLWEGALQMTPQGPGYMIVCWMTSPIVGQTLVNGLMVGNVNTLTEADADSAATTLLEGLRQQRSQALAESVAPTNGDAGPPQGLVVPGR